VLLKIQLRRLVLEQFGEKALCKYEIEHVLPVGLFDLPPSAITEMHRNPDVFPETEADAMPAAAMAATRSTWVSVAVNLVLSVGQMAIGILSRSQGLVADGIHSLSDLIADFVVLVASHHSKKPVDANHPYGHQRFETGASLALALILLLVGGGMSGLQSRSSSIPKLSSAFTLPRYG